VESLSTTKSPRNQNKFSLILAGILAVLFIVSTVAVVFSYFPARQILDPDFYKQTLADVQIYQNLPRVIAQQLASNITQDGESPSLTDAPNLNLLILSQEEWESILIDLLNPSWLQSQTESIIDQFFEILLKSPDPVNTPIVISLKELKSRLAGPEGSQVIKQILNAQPPCSVNQLLGLLQLGLGLPTSLDSLICRPPEYIISELTSAVEWLLSTVVDQVPDQVNVSLPETLFETSTPISSPDPEQEAIPDIIQDIRRINATVKWSPVLPLIILCLITILAVRSLNDFLIWWGGSLLTAGLITLILSLSLFPTTNWAFNRLIPRASGIYTGLSNILIQLGVADLSREIASRLVMSVVIPAIILVTIGFSLLLAYYLLARSSPPADKGQINSGHPIPTDIEE
jgi:hypothetical protein